METEDKSQEQRGFRKKKMSSGFSNRVRTGYELDKYPHEIESLESRHQQAASRAVCEILVYYILQSEGKPLLYATDRGSQVVIFASGFKSCIPGEVFLDLDKLNNQDHLDGWISTVTFHNTFPVSRHKDDDAGVELDRGLVVEVISPTYRKPYVQHMKERSLYRPRDLSQLKLSLSLTAVQQDRDKEVIRQVVLIISHFAGMYQSKPKFDLHVKDSDQYVLHADQLIGLPNNMLMVLYDLNKRDKFPERPIQTIQYHLPNTAYLEQHRLVIVIRRFRANDVSVERTRRENTVTTPTLVNAKRKTPDDEASLQADDPRDFNVVPKKNRTLDVFEITPLLGK